jgi:hypothetical protein
MSNLYCTNVQCKYKDVRVGPDQLYYLLLYRSTGEYSGVYSVLRTNSSTVT